MSHKDDELVASAFGRPLIINKVSWNNFKKHASARKGYEAGRKANRKNESLPNNPYVLDDSIRRLLLKRYYWQRGAEEGYYRNNGRRAKFLAKEARKSREQDKIDRERAKRQPKHLHEQRKHKHKRRK